MAVGFQDVHTKSFILLLAGGRWLGVRLDILSALLTGTVALAAVFVSEDPGRYLYKLDDDEYDKKSYENQNEGYLRPKTLSEKLT